MRRSVVETVILSLLAMITVSWTGDQPAHGQDAPASQIGEDAPASQIGQDTPASQIGPAEPSPDAARRIDQLRQSLDEVDGLILQNDFDEAKVKLEAVQTAFTAFGQELGSQVPPGYVKMFVVEERLGALRQQIDRRGAP